MCMTCMAILFTVYLSILLSHRITALPCDVVTDFALSLRGAPDVKQRLAEHGLGELH